MQKSYEIIESGEENPFSFSVGSIFFISFLCQIAAHLLLREYMMNVVFAAAAFLIIIFLLGYILIFRKDIFSFILVIYICSHFSYADNQGGLWNLITFVLGSIFFLFVRPYEAVRSNNLLIMMLLLLFVCLNVIGVIFKNPLPWVMRLQGLAAFFGFILMFGLAMKVEITPHRFRQFLLVSLVMLIYLIIVSINQRYAFVNWNTPLIGAYGAGHGVITYCTTNAKGTFRNSELFGEYAVLLFTLFMPLISSSATQRELYLSSKKIILMIILCLVCILLTSTRAAAILAVFVVVMYYAIFIFRPLVALDRIGRQLWLFLAIFIAFGFGGAYVGGDSLTSDFEELAGERFSVESVVSGKAINRGPLTMMAIKRIERNSWVIGYGYTVPRGNLWAWIGVDPEKVENSIAGFHNLYLSLPMIYGWLGMAAFLFLIVYSNLRLLVATIKHRFRDSFLVVVSLGLTFFWLIFLIDEYKISILRNPNYHMIFWIWLGLSNAVVGTLKLKQIDSDGMI